MKSNFKTHFLLYYICISIPGIYRPLATTEYRLVMVPAILFIQFCYLCSYCKYLVSKKHKIVQVTIRHSHQKSYGGGGNAGVLPPPPPPPNV